MGWNYCRRCGHSPASPGWGTIADPNRRWWQFWKTVTCPDCGGDGIAKPPGWPDRQKMRKYIERIMGHPSDRG